MTTDRKTMKASEVIAAMQSMIQQHGDRNVFFSDGFGRFGVNVHAESAPNFDSPQAFLVKAFNLETGRNEPSVPLNYSGNTANNDLRGNVASMDKDMMGVTRRTAFEDAARELQKVAFDSAYDAHTANHCVRVVLGLKHGGAAGQAFDPANPDSTVWDGMLAATPSPVPADTAELPPLPNTNYNGYSDGSEPLYTADQMRDYARAAIASRPAPVAEQEPVAWRIRPYDHVEQQHSDVWTLTRDPDVAAIYRSKKAIIEPLVVAAAPSQPDQSAQEVDADVPEAIRLLGEVFDAWENGTPCYEDGDHDSQYLGTAFRLDDATFHACCDLLNRRHPNIVNAAPAAPSAAQAAGVDAAPARHAIRNLREYLTNGGVFPNGAIGVLENFIDATTPSEGVAAPVEPSADAFKNFHRSLCARFDYPHDEQFWWRDQVSLEEHIAKLVQPAQPSADQVRDAALAECEGICADIYRKHRDQYKGRGGYAPDNPRRADPHCDGCADGAAECEEAISKLRTTASGEKGASK